MFSSYNSTCGAQKAIVCVSHLHEKCWLGGTAALYLAAVLQARAVRYPGSHALPTCCLPLRLHPEGRLLHLHRPAHGEQVAEEGGEGKGRQGWFLFIHILNKKNMPRILSYVKVFVALLK